MVEATAMQMATAFCAPVTPGLNPFGAFDSGIAVWKGHRGLDLRANPGKGRRGFRAAVSMASSSESRHRNSEVSAHATSGSSGKILSRRTALAPFITASVLAVGAFGGSNPANAASEKVWGAAELDFLMYICGATGKFCPAKTQVTIEAARTIDASFATTIAGIPSSVVSKNFGIPAEKLRAAVEEESKFYLAEFQKRIAFDPNDLSNQYSLDFNSYLTYLAVGKLLQDDAKKTQFQKLVGDQVLDAIASKGAKVEIVDARKGQKELDSVVQSCKSILETFATTKFISKYAVDTQEIDAGYFSPDGPPTSFSFTFDSPATLQALLQMSGEGSRFKPDYVGLALSAYFSKCSITSDYASYFVDTQYRPNPDDYQPTQVLAQFNLRPFK